MLRSIWFALGTLQAAGRKCAKTHSVQAQVVPCHIFPGSDVSDPGPAKLVSVINQRPTAEVAPAPSRCHPHTPAPLVVPDFCWFQIHGVNAIQ